jgi:hypothetical protein
MHPKTRPAIPAKLPATAIPKATAGLAPVRLASPNAMAIKPINDNATATISFQACPVVLIIVDININVVAGSCPDPAWFVGDLKINQLSRA